MTKRLISCFVALGFSLTACNQKATEPPTPSPAGTTDRADGVTVPDVMGQDLVRAVARLEEAGLDVDLSALPEAARGYATGFQTHPRVQVVEMDPPPGTLVDKGTEVAILRAECPQDEPC